MMEVIDGLSQQYTFAYDPLGRVTQITRGGHSMTLGYDAVGHRQSRTDYNGQTATYLYDNLNRLETNTYSDASTASYGYDDVSRLTSATNPTGTVSFAYDEMGRVESTTDVFGQVITYTYDDAGNRLSLNREHQSVSYEYDALNRLTQVGDSSGTASYTYNALGQPLTRTLPNGITTTYQYDHLHRLTTQQEGIAAGLLLGRQYQYNAAGQIAQVDESARETGEQTDVYNYDAVNRLTSATHTNQAAESYAYDAVGNRTSSHQESSYSYDPFNQLTATASGWEYSYDSNGNQVSKLDGGGHGAEWQYTWDSENRLTQVQLPFGESVSYQYDALGRRVQRTSTISGETTQYTYDGQDVILDTLADGNTVEYLNGPGVDNKLAVNDSQQGVFYLLHDQLGSVRAVTDATGMAIDHASSDSFGQGVASGVTRYAFTGREWDEDAGLYYYRARWYDQQQGRFISEDPIGLNGGINLYGYVENDPISATDPSGQDGDWRIGLRRPRRGRRARGVRVPAQPVAPIIDPPPPIQPPPPDGPPHEPRIPILTIDPPSLASEGCECDGGLRMPDFYTLGGSSPIPNPWVSAFGGSVNLSIDRNGRIYFSVGPVFSFPSPGGGSFLFGWLNTWCKPKPKQITDLLTGPSISGGGFTPLVIGGQETWSPGHGTATQIGFGWPPGGGVSGSWGWRLR